MIKKYLFVLGRSVKLAEAELKSILEKRLLFSDFSLTKNLVTIKSADETEKVADLINTLGGTVKIAELVEYGNWAEVIYQDLKSNPVRDVGFSSLDSKLKRNMVFDLKFTLKSEGINIRAVMPRESTFLNAAEIRSNKLIGKGREYVVVEQPPTKLRMVARNYESTNKAESDSGQAVYRTIAQQDIESQVERDYGKPRSNAVSGMVPPKLARMMVNIAANMAETQISKSKDQKDLNLEPCSLNLPQSLTVVDPFCGSGNILIEAFDLGYSVQGSDISGGEVQKTTENLEWLSGELGNRNKVSGVQKPNTYNLQPYTAFIADASKDDFLIGIESPIVIVAEPYLGEPHKEKLTDDQVTAEIDALTELYLAFFANLKRITDNGSRITICLIFPSFELQNGGQRSLYKEIVDKIGSFGYTSLVGPYEYGRDYQVVKREILLLRQK